MGTFGNATCHSRTVPAEIIEHLDEVAQTPSYLAA